MNIVRPLRPLLSRLFPLDQYTDPAQRRQAIGTYWVGALAFIALAIAGLTIIAQSSASQMTLDFRAVVDGILMLGAVAAAILFTQRGRNRVGAMFIISLWFLLSYYVQLTGGHDVLYTYPIMLLGISLGALLVGEGTVLPATALSMSVMILATTYNTNIPEDLGKSTLLPFLGIMVIHAAINYALARGIQQITRQMQAVVDARRLNLAEASNTISQRLLASRLDLAALLKEATSLVRDTFDQIDEIQIYLIDKERKNATLSATTYAPLSGDNGIGQQIGIGTLNVIGRVALSGQLILVRDTSDEQPQRRSAFLPGAKAELALPLIAGQETIGVLDLQSRDEKSFTTEDIEIFKTIANQIAVAVDNVRLYSEAQNRLTENQRLYDQARNSLREIERLNQQLTSTAWTEFLRSQPTIPAYSIDLASGQVENAADWTPTLAEASRRKQVLIRQLDDAKIVALPITVRGQVIGAMEFEIAPDQNVGAEQMTILQQVVERMGLAAENARLFEQTQRAAQREAIVNEISTRMQATTNIEAVVAAATQSLADVFQSSRVAIRLGTPTNSGS